MQEVRDKYKFGRAIAAPQIGIKKRLVYINIDKPMIIINPYYTFKSEELFEVWDDCMCFPNLLVKVMRHQKIRIKYRDENWKEQNVDFEGAMSELIQHEVDHLDGRLYPGRMTDLSKLIFESEIRHFTPAG